MMGQVDQMILWILLNFLLYFSQMIFYKKSPKKQIATLNINIRNKTNEALQDNSKIGEWKDDVLKQKIFFV